MCLHRLAILLGKLVLIGLLGEAKTVVLHESRLHWVVLVGAEQLRRVLDLPRSRKHSQEGIFHSGDIEFMGFMSSLCLHLLGSLVEPESHLQDILALSVSRLH